MTSVNCDACKWCQSKGCNEHEKFAVWYPPAPAHGVTLAPGGLREAAQTFSDELLRHRSGMRSEFPYAEWRVLRAALASPEPALLAEP